MLFLCMSICIQVSDHIQNLYYTTYVEKETDRLAGMYLFNVCLWQDKVSISNYTIFLSPLPLRFLSPRWWITILKHLRVSKMNVYSPHS